MFPGPLSAVVALLMLLQLVLLLASSVRVWTVCGTLAARTRGRPWQLFAKRRDDARGRQGREPCTGPHQCRSCPQEDLRQVWVCGTTAVELFFGWLVSWAAETHLMLHLSPHLLSLGSTWIALCPSKEELHCFPCLGSGGEGKASVFTIMCWDCAL